MYVLIAQTQKKNPEKKWLMMKTEIAYKFVYYVKHYRTEKFRGIFMKVM